MNLHDELRAAGVPAPSDPTAEEARTLEVGRHCLMELHHCAGGALNDANALEHTLRACVREGGLTLVRLVVHAFAPHGLTAVAVLQESHLAVHTWPELAFAAADLFICDADANPTRVQQALVEGFRPRLNTIRCFARAALVGDVPGGAPEAS